MFADRVEAGRRLGEKVRAALGAAPDAVVLALPRGGVPVADEVARAIGAPLDVAMAHKIGAPMQPELAIGAVCDGRNPAVVYDERDAERIGVPPDEIERLGRRELADLRAKGERYRSGREAIDVNGKTAVIVDDGVATGWTLRAALRAVRARGAARVVVAVPVAPREALARFEHDSDLVVCLESPAPFYAVGAHYRDFAQVTDDEVRDALTSLSPQDSG